MSVFDYEGGACLSGELVLVTLHGDRAVLMMIGMKWEFPDEFNRACLDAWAASEAKAAAAAAAAAK